MSPRAIMVACFLHHFCRSSISNANFSVLTKCWVPILLLKFSEDVLFSENGKIILVSMEL